MPLLETIGSSGARGFGLFGKLALDGLTAATAADSAVKLKIDFPSISSGTYWIKINGTPRQIYCDMATDGGGWMLVYELTNPDRGSVVTDAFSYAVDNSSWFGDSFTFNRVAYRLQNNMGNGGTSYYTWASVDKFTGLTPGKVRPPDINNQYAFQTNANNLFVESNYNQSWVTNRNGGDTARIEMWPSNYGTGPGAYGDGDNSIYDHDDSGFSESSMGYGCYQVFNLNTGLNNSRQCVLAWNNHNAAPSAQCVGFGKNVNGNPFYTASGQVDWTFADNGAYNFKVQGFIK